MTRETITLTRLFARVAFQARSLGSDARPKFPTACLSNHSALASWGAWKVAWEMAPHSQATRSAWRGGGCSVRCIMFVLCNLRTGCARIRATDTRTTRPWIPWQVIQCDATSNLKNELATLHRREALVQISCRQKDTCIAARDTDPLLAMFVLLREVCGKSHGRCKGMNTAQTCATGMLRLSMQSRSQEARAAASSHHLVLGAWHVTGYTSWTAIRLRVLDDLGEGSVERCKSPLLVVRWAKRLRVFPGAVWTVQRAVQRGHVFSTHIPASRLMQRALAARTTETVGIAEAPLENGFDNG